ncbi:MAG: hypothetical protein ACI8P9_004324 [Parasphingorhabdus sp.]|jgi:hypothetical protein
MSEFKQLTSYQLQKTPMNIITKYFKWVMLVFGTLTFTMFYGLFAPQAALESMFGASFDGTLETLVVRSWSALVGLMGAMLIYGAYSENNRIFSISIVAVSKVIFVSLMFLYGQAFLGTAGMAIIMDCIFIILSGFYLIAIVIKGPIIDKTI